MSEEREDPGTVTDALETVASGGMLVVGSKVVALGFGFLTQLVMARLLLPEAYGSVALALAVISVATMIAMLGLDEGVTRKVPEYEDDHSRTRGVVRAGLRLGAVSSLAVAAAIVLSAPTIGARIFGDPSLTVLLRIGALSIPFMVVGQIALKVTRGFRSARPYAYVYQVLRPAARLVFIGLFVGAGFGAVGAVAGQMAALVVMGIVGLAYTYRLLPSWRDVSPAGMDRTVLAFSLPLMVTVGMDYLIAYTDTFVIGYLLTADDVGIYNISFQLRGGIVTAVVASGFLLPPVLTRLQVNEQMRELRVVYRVITKWVVFLTLPVFLAVFVFPQGILVTLFGGGYAEGGPALQVLGLGAIASAAMGSTSQSLIGLGKNRTVLYTTGLSAIVNVVLNVVLIPLLGILGAAIASTTAIVLKHTANVTVLYRNFGIVPLSRGGVTASAVCLLSSGVAYLLITAIQLPAAIVSPAWLILYPLLFLRFGGVTPEDKRFVKQIEDRTGRQFPRPRDSLDTSE
ncbi:oligosaccharide flippase family protein [Natrinema caseinilyticum]|uniref:oligosaccharide flippase family protein n=1 Tax=Natrinema caseinilyticum TaxID=2961570 RepID=UPI0020C2162B|nr:oligosaccharide flippase family protein [Natrinema caseinilyticum]